MLPFGLWSFLVCKCCGLKASYGSCWRMQRYHLRKPTQLERQLSLWTFHTSFVFTDVVKVKIKDKFMMREKVAKLCLSLIALFPRLKQGHYTLCRRRCIQSLPLEKLGKIRSGGIHSMLHCISSEEMSLQTQFQFLLPD